MPFDWNRFTNVDVAEWTVGLAAFVLFSLPALFTTLGVRLIRFRAVADPSLVEPDGNDPEYAERYAELAALGFRPAGVVRETSWFYLHDIYKCHAVRFLVGADGQTYAAVYRLGFGPGSLLRLTFDSVTDGEVLVQTAVPGAEFTADDPDYHRVEVPWSDVAGSVAAHQKHTADVTARDGGKLKAVGLDELAEIDERTSLRTLPRVSDAGLAKLLLAVGWLFPFLGTLALLAVASAADWPRRVGASLLVAAAGYVVLAFKITPAFLQLIEQCDPTDEADRENPDG